MKTFYVNQKIFDLLMQAKPEYVECVTCAENAPWYILIPCNAKDCDNPSVCTLTLAERCNGIDTGRFLGQFRTVHLCADHIPDNVKALPVFKLAKFKERARGSDVKT